MTSDFVPYATHPDLPQFHSQLDLYAAEIEEMGRKVRAQDVRLSMHPSQYIVLNAEKEEVASKAVLDLSVQANLLDAMGLDAEAVLVLHVGGSYGDKEAAMGRFCLRYEKLPEPVRRRLVIENDENSFSVRDCLWIHERTGVPIVFDHQHHRLLSGEMDVSTAARGALSTWKGRGIRPKMHFSSARLDGKETRSKGVIEVKAPLLRQHADYIDPWTFGDFVGTLSDLQFDVMLEAKAKDLALRKLRSDLRRLGMSEVLRQPIAPPAREAPLI